MDKNISYIVPITSIFMTFSDYLKLIWICFSILLEFILKLDIGNKQLKYSFNMTLPEASFPADQ